MSKQVQEREREFNIVVGAPGHGKSTAVSRVIDNSTDRNALVYKMHLNLDDKAFKKFPKLNKLSDYKGGKVKLSEVVVKYPELLKRVMDSYRNGILCIDDAGLYERDIISNELNDIVIMRRHIGVDVFLVYHGLSFLPIQQFPYINNIILFHTTDNFGYKLSRIPDGKRLLEAKARIAEQVKRGNKYYSEVIKFA